MALGLVTKEKQGRVRFNENAAVGSDGDMDIIVFSEGRGQNRHLMEHPIGGAKQTPEMGKEAERTAVGDGGAVCRAEKTPCAEFGKMSRKVQTGSSALPRY